MQSTRHHPDQPATLPPSDPYRTTRCHPTRTTTPHPTLRNTPAESPQTRHPGAHRPPAPHNETPTPPSLPPAHQQPPTRSQTVPSQATHEQTQTRPPPHGLTFYSLKPPNRFPGTQQPHRTNKKVAGGTGKREHSLHRPTHPAPVSY